MAEVLSLIGSCQPSSLTRQLVAVAGPLRELGVDLRVIVLDRPSVWSAALKQAGVPVEEIGLCGVFDLPPFLVLRKRIRAHQGAIHAWGLSAFRVARAAGAVAQRLFASGLFREQGRLSWLDRRFLRGVRCVAFTAQEADRAHHLGLPVERVRPGLPDPGVAKRTSLPGIPDDFALLLGLGPLEPRKAFREAIYLNDMLRYIADRNHLVLIGEGEGKHALGDLVEKFAAWPAVHFPGWVTDLAPYLGRADVVVAPAREAGSVYAVLDAMLAGRPVVAADTPDLAEIIKHGETGRLFPVGDRMQFGREVRTFLDDDDLRQTTAQSARNEVLRSHAVAPLANTLKQLWQTIG